MVSLGELSDRAQDITTPKPQQLVDMTWRFRTPGAALPDALCRLRKFLTGPQHVTVILTEVPENHGLSITNANERQCILPQLQMGDPGAFIRIIEQWYPGRADEHFDEVFILPFGVTGWRRIEKTVIYAEFGQHLVDG